MKFFKLCRSRLLKTRADRRFVTICVGVILATTLNGALILCQFCQKESPQFVTSLEVKSQSQDLPSTPAQLSAVAKEWKREAELARAWLAAGRAGPALKVFEEAWNSGRHAGWSRGRVALYISLCYQQRAQLDRANVWLQHVRKEGLPELGDEAPNLLASVGLKDDISDKRRKFQFVSLGAEEGHVSEDEVAQLQQAVGRLRTSHEQFDNSQLESKVRYATWLLLVAELTSKWDDLCLTTTSVETFAAGKELLAAIATEIDGDPRLQQQLEQNAALAVRFDAAQARINVLKQS